MRAGPLFIALAAPTASMACVGEAAAPAPAAIEPAPRTPIMVDLGASPELWIALGSGRHGSLYVHCETTVGEPDQFTARCEEVPDRRYPQSNAEEAAARIGDGPWALRAHRLPEERVELCVGPRRATLERSFRTSHYELDGSGEGGALSGRRRAAGRRSRRGPRPS